MRRAAAGLALLVSVVASAAEPLRLRESGRDGARAGERVARVPPAFEFAPASGIGVDGPCVCAAVTGTRGQLLTFTRASNGVCTKGNETSGIVNGDLVTCPSGRPRMMRGGDGTGPVGISVWEERTNSLLRSAEFDNAIWLKVGAFGVAAPTVTANFAVAPDGTTTAERIQIPTSIGFPTGASFLQQGGSTSTDASAGVYVKGTSGSGAFEMFTGPSPYTITVCSFNSVTWTRCLDHDYNGSGGGTQIFLGVSPLAGGAQYPAIDVLFWGADSQAGVTLGPPIATAGTSATRLIETAAILTAAFQVPPDFTTRGSAAATVVSSNPTLAPPAPAGPGGIVSYGTNGRLLFAVSNTARIFDGTTTVEDTITYVAGSPVRFWSSWDSLTASMSLSGTGAATSGAFDGTMAFSLGVAFGSAPAGFGGPTSINAVVKQVCIDRDPSRCR